MLVEVVRFLVSIGETILIIAKLNGMRTITITALPKGKSMQDL